MIGFSLKSREIDDFIARLGRRGRTAAARAINRTATSERAELAREVSKNIGIKVGTVKEEIRLEKATPDRLVAKMTVRGKRIPLIEFSARGPEPSRGRGRGVSYRLPGSGRNRAEKAFIATMRSGHRGVFQRVTGGKKRGPRPMRSQLPIFELFGPSIAAVFGKLAPKSNDRRTEKLTKNLRAEFTYALSKGAL